MSEKGGGFDLGGVMSGGFMSGIQLQDALVASDRLSSRGVLQPNTRKRGGAQRDGRCSTDSELLWLHGSTWLPNA